MKKIIAIRFEGFKDSMGADILTVEFNDGKSDSLYFHGLQGIHTKDENFLSVMDKLKSEGK